MKADTLSRSEKTDAIGKCIVDIFNESPDMSVSDAMTECAVRIYERKKYIKKKR